MNRRTCLPSAALKPKARRGETQWAELRTGTPADQEKRTNTCEFARRQFLDRGGWELPLCGSRDRKSTRLNSSHVKISYAVFCLKKKKKKIKTNNTIDENNRYVRLKHHKTRSLKFEPRIQLGLSVAASAHTLTSMHWLLADCCSH